MTTLQAAENSTSMLAENTHIQQLMNAVPTCVRGAHKSMPRAPALPGVYISCRSYIYYFRVHLSCELCTLRTLRTFRASTSCG